MFVVLALKMTIHIIVVVTLWQLSSRCLALRDISGLVVCFLLIPRLGTLCCEERKDTKRNMVMVKDPRRRISLCDTCYIYIRYTLNSG